MSIDNFIRYLGKVLFFVVLQIFVLNNIHISSMGITPYLYIILILLIPFETPGWLLLLSAFFIGLSIDIAQDTGGAHASASVFVAFLRPLILKLIAPRDGYESGTSPTLFYMGTPWFIKYSAIIIFIHQLVYTYLEAFTFVGFFYNFLNLIFVSIFTLIIVFLSQFLIFRK